jgi:hypothetical protein
VQEQMQGWLAAVLHAPDKAGATEGGFRRRAALSFLHWKV